MGVIFITWVKIPEDTFLRDEAHMFYGDLQIIILYPKYSPILFHRKTTVMILSFWTGRSKQTV